MIGGRDTFFLNLSLWPFPICTKSPQRLAGAPQMPKAHIYMPQIGDWPPLFEPGSYSTGSRFR